jgi:hypothetical protein
MTQKTTTINKSTRDRVGHLGIGIAAVALGLLLFGCASARIASEREVGRHRPPGPL